MQYGEQANGAELSLRLNEEIDIVLMETRTAGYRWTIAANGEPIVTLLKEESLPSSAGAGGTGQRHWRFRAVSLGDAEIKIQYARSWEKMLEPARTFSLKVRVES